MQIPPEALDSETLHAVVLEFVTRDGPDHSPVEPRIELVVTQLMNGRAELHYDEDSKSCNILPVSI